MSLAFFLRNNLPELPYYIGKYVSLIPYSHRPGIGMNYKKATIEINAYERSTEIKKKEFIYTHIKKLTEYAYNTIPFYNTLYKDNKFNPNLLNSFSDIKNIPVINKEILLQYGIEERSNIHTKRMLVNTGGSSGNTLSFFIQPSKIGNEWAHLHYIWKKQLNFDPKKLKLLLVGRSKVNDIVSYDYMRNSLRIDIYKPFNLISNIILTKFKDIPIYYLHGYPSAIYELALYCQQDHYLLIKIKSDLKGCILNSEFPEISKRQVIEDTFQVKSFAFYGHTEGCVLAFETIPNYYEPVHSYGYSEIFSHNNKNQLIGTSYYNFASPLIRYNTEDEVENYIVKDDLLKSFSIKEGRSSEYILDRNGKKIPITGLIFGRHHKLFDFCSSVQIKQELPGFATIYYVPKVDFRAEIHLLFDSSNVEMEFRFEKIDQPIKTISGKVKPLIH